MKVLSIGPDKDLLKKGSPSFERHACYAQKMGALHAVVFARKKYGKERVRIAENAWAYPTHAGSAGGLLWHAFLLGVQILRKAKREGSLSREWVVSAQDPFESGLVAFALSLFFRVPLLLQVHGDFFSPPYYWRRESILNYVRFFAGLFLLRRAEGVRVVSERIKRALVERGVSAERIFVSAVYTDVSLFQDAPPDKEIQALKREGEVLVLSMARFSPEKNLALQVCACERVRERGTPLSLVLVGRGKEEGMLRGFAKKYTWVHVLSWREHPAGAFRLADVYALSSLYEGWGRVCVEALASGTPLLMTNVGCAGELVVHEKNGLVVPVGDEEAFSLALEHLVRDKTLRERLAEEGERSVALLPTKEESIQAYVAIVEKVLCTR